MQSPAQREVLDRITALMTLLEGHAEFVMDSVGPDVVPTVLDIRASSTAVAIRPMRSRGCYGACWELMPNCVSTPKVDGLYSELWTWLG